MEIIRDDSRLTNITEINDFLKSSKKVVLKITSIEQKYDFIQKAVSKFKYHKLSKHDKRSVLLYLKKITGFKKTQMHKLIKHAVHHKLIRKEYIRVNPNITYKPYDIKLLEKTDELHLRLNSLATKEIMRREFEIFGNVEYQNISKVSHSHINNLRKTNLYKNTWVNPTKPNEVKIGITKKPENNQLPGSIRVDTVHQNGIYHINAVDEITQWEIVISVPKISEIFLEDALYEILLQFPFVIFNFHSDRGSEFINHLVAKILNKLLIKQTKSRSSHCNDNALVESKNGSVVRKNFGYFYVNQNLCDKLNTFHKNFFNPYLNYHRPCLYVTEVLVSSKGRERKIYGHATPPYEKLKEICNLPENKSKHILRNDETFDKFDKIAYEYSDNQFASIMRNEQRKVFSLNKVLETSV